MKAIWNNTIIAESDATVEVEGNQYFPPQSLNRQFVEESDTHTTCGWKGVASYYSLKVNNQSNKDCAWYYPEPTQEAKKIKGYVAFWRGVQIQQ